MIFHYVNLVVWEDIFAVYNDSHDVLMCDSISLRICCKLFGDSDPELRPGSSILKTQKKYFQPESDALFLVSKDLDAYKLLNSETLPQNMDLSAYQNGNLTSDFSTRKTVFIGISSPKQNLLAKAIYRDFPRLDIYCVGAVLDSLEQNNVRDLQKYSGSGFEWFFHMLRDPKRFMSKIYRTLTVIAKLVANKSYRRKFRHFSTLLR